MPFTFRDLASKGGLHHPEMTVFTLCVRGQETCMPSEKLTP